MNVSKRLARARAKARANRISRWKHGAARNPNRAKPRSGPLVASRGPGSINAEAEMQRLVRAGRDAEAAKFWEDCHNIFHKCGEPKMRYGESWYRQYKRRVAA